MNYDIACGMDNATLNQVVLQVYRALYPALLKDTINIGQLNVASVGFDINQTPSVQLAQSKEAQSYFEKALVENRYGTPANLSTEHRTGLLAAANAVSFNFDMPSLEITITYTGGQQPTNVNASLTGSATIQTWTQGSQNYLTIRILTATINVPTDPALTQLLNNIFVPLFILYLNNNILSNINVPALQYQSLQISMPVPAVQPPFLTAYSALGSVQPDVPPPSQWPTGCVFIALDANLLKSAAALPFPLGPSTGFDWDIISGQVGAQVTAPNPVSVNSDGSISATIVAQAECQLTLHTPNWLPNVNFGPSATASISATFQPSVVNGELYISIEGVPIPTFSFDWGIPGWINWLFYPLEAGLAAALNAVLGPLIGKVLKFPPIPILKIPTISFTLAGIPININIVNAVTGGQNSLLLVRSQLNVSGRNNGVPRGALTATTSDVRSPALV